MLWHWWVRRVLMMHGSKYKDSILHIPAQHTQIQWRQPLLVCCFLEDYNIYGLQDMHKQMAKSLSWLVFPFHLCIIVFKLWLWMPINTQTKDCTASLRSAWVAPVSPTTLLGVLDRNPSEKFAELIRYLCLTSMISHQSQWDTACLATEGTWQWGFCM